MLRTSILLDADNLSIWLNGPLRTGCVSLCSKRRIAVSVNEVGAKLLGLNYKIIKIIDLLIVWLDFLKLDMFNISIF